MTPWADCIKEGTEPWKSQRWSFTSHVQHPAPGVLAIVSLALLGTYRADQQTTPERGPQEAGSSTRLGNAPSATPAATPHPLQRVIESCSPPTSNGCNIGTRLPWDLPLGKRETELYDIVTVYLVIRL